MLDFNIITSIYSLCVDVFLKNIMGPAAYRVWFMKQLQCFLITRYQLVSYSRHDRIIIGPIVNSHG